VLPVELELVQLPVLLWLVKEQVMEAQQHNWRKLGFGGVPLMDSQTTSQGAFGSTLKADGTAKVKSGPASKNLEIDATYYAFRC